MSEQELGVKYLQEAEDLENKIANGEIKSNDEDVASLVSLGFSSNRKFFFFFELRKGSNQSNKQKKKKVYVKMKKVLIQLRQLFAQMQSGDIENVSTKEITKSFGWLNKEATIQHDAHELNRILLDALERSINDMAKNKLIDEIYQGKT
ncbi:peptidase C19 family protein, partial [Reticulomyxa filosa]